MRENGRRDEEKILAQPGIEPELSSPYPVTIPTERKQTHMKRGLGTAILYEGCNDMWSLADRHRWLQTDDWLLCPQHYRRC
jgi:hypothetical protein